LFISDRKDYAVRRWKAFRVSYTRTPGILSPNEARHFWIDWSSASRIYFGIGDTVQDNTVLCFNDRDPYRPLTNVSVMGTALWKIGTC